MLSVLSISRFLLTLQAEETERLKKLCQGIKTLFFGCYNEYSAAREDFVVDCNEFDYYPEPEDNFDAMQTKTLAWAQNCL